ncbi:MAG: response regulator transcription factor [Methylococcales bacterium]|jgi:two-component system, NarL family, invasion response regulator UvrY
MNTMKKIAIADDHDIIRYAIKLLLEKNPVLSVVADTNELAKIVEMCRANKPDLLLLDINFENGDSLNILKQLKKEDRHLKILVYSAHEEMKYAFRALKLGASGYLTKQQAVESLPEAIECVLQGKKYISAALAQELANRVQDDFEAAEYEKLSERELQTLQLIASGLSVGDIAERLNLSVKTISMYRSRVLTKLDLRHNADLMRYAMDNHLVS